MNSPNVRYIKKSMPTREQDLESVSNLVKEILRRVRNEGEKAVREYSERFDNLNPASFQVSKEEIQRAESKVTDSFKENVKFLRDDLRIETQGETQAKGEGNLTSLRGFIDAFFEFSEFLVMRKEHR